jgi:hypothetical protein
MTRCESIRHVGEFTHRQDPKVVSVITYYALVLL